MCSDEDHVAWYLLPDPTHPTNAVHLEQHKYERATKRDKNNP